MVAAPTRRLIVSADDFGMSPGVNAAVIRAHREGILTETSVMVTGAAWREAADLARQHPRLGVGLHLALVQARAAVSPSRLAGADGMLGAHPIVHGLRYFFTPGIRAALRREIVAQLERFHATGLALSHVDGHLMLHMHPTVLRLLLDLAPAYGVRAVRLPREPLRPALAFSRRHLARKLFEAAIFTALARHAAPRLAAAGIAHADRMYGMHQTGHVTEPYLMHLCATLPPGISELYAHPALPDAESARWRPADYEPLAELAALTSPRIVAVLRDAGIELVGYAALGDHQGQGAA